MLKCLKHFFLLLLQYLLPHHHFSKWLGSLAHTEQPALKRFLIRRFIQHFKVDMRESLRSEHEFEHFNAFFTRHLKSGARPIHPEISSIVSPCDGTVLDAGPLKPESVLHAKGHPFDLNTLLGETQSLEHFVPAQYATIYLAPKDYHRVHMPYTGKLERTVYIPGKLFSVNPFILQKIPQVFARNERLICYFSSDLGPMIVIFVGAMVVSGIRTAWKGHSKLYTHNVIKGHYSARNLIYQKGQEIGHFELGSTIILLVPERAQLELTSGQTVKVGEKIGVR